MSRKSLQTALTRNYILIGLLPSLLLGLTAIYILSQSLDREVRSQNFTLANAMAGEVETFLKEPLSLLMQMRDVIGAPGLLVPDGTNNYLQSVVANYPYFEMVQHLDPEGKVEHLAPYDEDYLGLDMSRQRFFEATLDNQEPYWSPTFISMRSGIPTVTLSVPAQRGMLVGYLNLRTLSAIVAKLNNSHTSAIITDQEGTVIADAKTTRVLERVNLSSSSPIALGLAGKEGTIIYPDTRQGREMIASVVTIDMTGWLVVLLQPTETAFAPVQSIRQMLGLFLLLTLVVAVGAALLTAKVSITPFRRLLTNVKRIAAGDYTTPPAHTGFKETMELDDHFRAMADAVKSREESLKFSERLHRELVESLPLGIQEHDLDGLIVFTNPAYEHIFECAPGGAIGKYFWESAVDQAEQATLIQNHQLLITQQPPATPYQAKARTHLGNIIDIQVDWQYRRDEQGQLLGFTSLITDISERRQLEASLRQAQKMEAVGTLAGGIAHDFNNILAAILGYSEMVLDNLPEGSDDNHFQRQIVKACHRARELVQHLLIYSRKQESVRKPVAIAEVVSEAMKLLRATLPTTIAMHLDISEEAGIIEADSTQIHQVVINLCTNAAHAMEKGGGALSVSVHRTRHQATVPMTVHGKSEIEESVELVVSDTGAGMSDKVVERIFDPFFTTKETGKGTGMGLAVVHGIVTSHGGSIEVRSKVGAGTTFTIRLPLIDDVSAPVSTSSPVVLGRGEKILVIDDERPIATVLEMMLDRLGYQATAITDSRQALQLFAENADQFSLVITDQTMPHLTGFEFARQLREMNGEIPILLCTGYSSTVDEAAARGIGINGFLMKPISRDTLASKVAELLGDS